MSAFIGDMTPEAGNETQTDESGLEREEIITETQEATVSSSQQTNELLRPNLRHRMLQKTGLSEPQPKDDTVEYPADDQYGLFEQVSYDTYDTNSVGLEQSSFYIFIKNTIQCIKVIINGCYVIFFQNTTGVATNRGFMGLMYIVF